MTSRAGNFPTLACSAVALVLGIASASHARTEPNIDNPSFEQGLASWQIGFTSIASTLDSSFEGLPPTDGAKMSVQIAGMMTPAAAESWMGLAPGTLQNYYSSIGGIGATGNYSVIRRLLPAGEFSFDWLTEDGDVFDPEHLDHTFYIVDGVIHPLGNGMDAPRGNWTSESFTTRGGIMYLVSANGGDIVLGPNLYTDNFRVERTPACPGDADGDSLVNLNDVANLISHWGQSGFLSADLDGDLVVGLSDMSIVIMHWNTDCRGGES